MVKLTVARRHRLPTKMFACPSTGSYPIHDRSHVASARSYYKRKYTEKCSGGKQRICRRARQLGMLKPSYPGASGWKKWCG